MSEPSNGPEFLKQRYPGLPDSPEIVKAAIRTASRTGTAVSRDPETRIQNYLDRFKEIVERDDPKERENGITALKKILVSKYVVRVEDIPDSYWQAQMRVVRQRGESGDWQTLPEKEQIELKRKHLAQSKEDQQGSLEEWVDYLASDKSSYLPDYLKYWAFQGMLRLERYEKGNEEKGIKGRFPQRPTGRQRSIKMFPEVNERALKFIASAYKAQATNQSISFRYDISSSARTEFLGALGEKDFRLLYGWGQENIPPISEDEMRTTEGEWLTYSQDSDPKILAKSLQGKGSGWCIAGENLAKQYLSHGNLHVYYTHDKEGKPTIPRVVIVQRGNQVSEVRGIEWEENIDNYIKDTNIIGDKLKEIPGGEAFFEIDADMKRLTAIDKKMASRGLLTGEELTFLYEIDKQIKYFGIKKDPRIAELRSQRKPEEDMLIVFGCSRDQIARNVREINKDTKAYVGALESGIFDKLQNIEHMYTSFPERKIKQTIEIGGKSVQQMERELEVADIRVGVFPEDLLHSSDFTTLENPKRLNLVYLTVENLGLSGNPTIDQIYSQAEDFGLELCPAEAGLFLLVDTNQPLGDRIIAMKPIVGDVGGTPGIFCLRYYVGSTILDVRWASPQHRFDIKDEFAFSLRPPVGEASKVI